jgi:hypothetical protein
MFNHCLHLLLGCRWAMLGAAGILGVEVLGQGDWYSAQLPLFQGAKATYMGITIPFDLGTILAIVSQYLTLISHCNFSSFCKQYKAAAAN